MKAIIKSMWVNSSSINLDSYLPDDPEKFGLWIEFGIGPSDAAGSDDYRVLVCTPDWLRDTVWEPRWGRHMLIVRMYDRSAIEKCVQDYVAKCTGADWADIAEKIARNLFWEFEDFQ